jgi:UDP-GlcNAc:undecaprenyl-phosphate GlcNAc-1-phosphate transferase
MNLIDGLDGLAGGVALVAVSTIFLISVHHVQPLMILFCAALAGAVVGFLFYNFNPASIFMGDTGSMFLGFVLATSSIKTGHKSSTAFAVVLIILGFPILDTLLAMSRRALRGRPIFHADREHIHHRLLALGLSQRQAVLLLYAVCLIFSGVALAITYTGNPALSITLVTILAVTLLVCLRRLGYIKLDLNHYLSDQRRRNRYLNAAVRPFSLSLRDAATPDEIWAVVRGVSAVFEAECASLQLPIADASFSSGFLDDKTDGVFRVRFSLARVRKDPRCVEFGWRDGRATLDRDIEIAIELFCNHVGDAAERIMSKSLVRAGKSVALPSE